MQAARGSLEGAVAAAAKSGPPATDYEAAQLQLRLGSVYWCVCGRPLVRSQITAKGRQHQTLACLCCREQQ